MFWRGRRVLVEGDVGGEVGFVSCRNHRVAAHRAFIAELTDRVWLRVETRLGWGNRWCS